MTHDIRPRLFVTGATGQLGRLVIGELLKRVPASSIVAGVRSPDHEAARQFSAQGVEIRVADYTRPDTLSSAFEGIGRLPAGRTIGRLRITAATGSRLPAPQLSWKRVGKV